MRIREASLAALLLCASAAPAAAFCRTTSCQAGDCKPRADCPTCLDGGRVLYWKSRCLSFAVSQDGTTQANISGAAAHEIIAGAFQAWLGADCQGSAPSLSVLDLGQVACTDTSYERYDSNVNLWVFRDGKWPHAGRGLMLALTTVTYDVDSGLILDADVEINSAQNPITAGDDWVHTDLASIAVHEAGHFLGLAHSCAGDATMFPAYVAGTTEMRSLELDDAQGLCSVFPPTLKKVCEPEPNNGLAACAQSAPSPDGAEAASCAIRGRGTTTVWWLLLPLVALRRSWRRR